jgi:hypothetical protein
MVYNPSWNRFSISITETSWKKATKR